MNTPRFRLPALAGLVVALTLFALACGAASTDTPRNAGRELPAAEARENANQPPSSRLSVQAGDLLWRYQTGHWVESSPAVADGVVYVGSYDTNVYALGAGSAP